MQKFCRDGSSAVILELGLMVQHSALQAHEKKKALIIQ